MGLVKVALPVWERLEVRRSTVHLVGVRLGQGNEGILTTTALSIVEAEFAGNRDEHTVFWLGVHAYW